MKKIILYKDKFPQGITILNKIIVKRSEELITIFSSICTHEGCKINKTCDGRLICPCHKSEYSFYGWPLKGPAPLPLREIDFEENTKMGEIILFA